MPQAIAHSRYRLRRVTDVALFIAIVLVIARAMALETLRDPFEITPGSKPVPRALTASASIVTDWLAILPAALVLFRNAFDRSFRLSLAACLIPAIFLAIWAVTSALWSHDRFAAVVGASHFVAGIALLWAIAQLVRTWKTLRLVAGVGFALLLCLTAQGLIYRFVELPDVQRSIERDWPNILQQRGWDADSFTAIQFHKKAMSGDSVGFSVSPNTFGAILVMLMLVSTGIAIQRLRDCDQPVWPIVIGIAMVFAGIVLGYTKSRAAGATAILGVILLPIIALAGPTIARRRAAIFIATIVLIFAGGALAIGYGVKHHVARDTLTFRWRYWTAASQLVRENPVLGVGWNNFGDRYLAVRAPVASEEIKDPHNLLVRFASELGIVGLTLAILWLLGMWWEMTRPDEAPRIHDATGTPGLPILVWLATVAMAVNVLASLDLSQDANWVFIEVIKRFLFTGLILIALIIATIRSLKIHALDPRPANWTRTMIVISIGMFLLHNAIDISFFETGPMWVFMMLCGAALGLKLKSDRAPKNLRAISIASLAVFLISWFAAGALIVAPIVVAENDALAGDVSLQGNGPADAAKSYLAAYSELPFSNADYLVRAARAQMYAQAPANEVTATLDRAIQANPISEQALTLAARYAVDRFNSDAAIANFTRAIAVDPNNVDLRLDFADALLKFNHRNEAIEQYEIALKKNDRLAWDEPKRLSELKLQQIRSRLHSLGR